MGEVIPSWNGDGVFMGESLTHHTKQMKVFIATVFLFATTPVHAAATSVALNSVPQVPAGFEYITQGANDDIYFGKVLARQGDQSWTSIHMIKPSGESFQWVSQYNCKDNTYSLGDGKGWEAIDPESVGSDMILFGCRD